MTLLATSFLETYFGDLLCRVPSFLKAKNHETSSTLQAIIVLSKVNPTAGTLKLFVGHENLSGICYSRFFISTLWSSFKETNAAEVATTNISF
jgi:hypothetical protein